MEPLVKDAPKLRTSPFIKAFRGSEVVRCSTVLYVVFTNTLATVGSDVLEIVVPLFECAGELGDNNGLYTYAQLLRTGEVYQYTHGQTWRLCSCTPPSWQHV